MHDENRKRLRECADTFDAMVERLANVVAYYKDGWLTELETAQIVAETSATLTSAAYGHKIAELVIMVADARESADVH